MSFFNKVKDWIAPGENEEGSEAVVAVESRRTNEPVVKGANIVGANDTKMVLFEPRSFDDAQVVAKRLKENRAVVVNLQKLRTDAAQRTIDFLTGVLFALEGSIHQIGEKVFLFAPSTVPVDGAITGSGEPQE